MQQYEELRRQEQQLTGLGTGIVRIGTVSSVSCHWLPGIIQKFWAEYPNVQLVMHQGDYTSICDWVQSGAVDIGFVNPAAAKGLQTQVLASGPFVAVLPQNHPLAQKRSYRGMTWSRSPIFCWRRAATASRWRPFTKKGSAPISA